MTPQKPENQTSDLVGILEARARRAWIRLTHSRSPLTAIAYELEFSDLAHMSRSVSAFTGFAPSRWRVEATAPEPVDQLR
jgi:AraC-like DNA-binding protein